MHDEIPELQELDKDFDLESTCPDIVSESLGLKELPLEKLLDLLQRGNDNAVISLLDFNRSEMEQYWNIGRKYAPICYEIYIRLFRMSNEPRLPIMCVISRNNACMCYPDTIIFWADPDLTRCLYESLKKDGFYGRT